MRSILFSKLFFASIYFLYAQTIPFTFWKSPKLCPPGYTSVPALPGYSSVDFCVGTYEAKQSGAKGVSLPTGTPWIDVTRPEAITACQANGAGYDLISNDQWQTIARNIENVAINWSSGTVGTGAVNRGNSASTASSQGCTGSDGLYGNNGGSGCSATVNFTLKRTHRLSNGYEIWDFAGNVNEWIKDANANYSLTTFISQLTDPTAKSAFGPGGTYTPLNTGEYGGLGKFSSFSAGGATFRGGNWGEGTTSGIFRAETAFSNTDKYNDLGFRCVYVIP